VYACHVPVTFICGTVSSPDAEDTVEFLVDSGATYTLLPESAWKKLRLRPRRHLRFRLADGQVMERDVSQCDISLEGLGETATPVVLGGPGDQALLGADTLEELGLVLNPFTRTLHPMNLLLV
jgi:clan AA aspartic protease